MSGTMIANDILDDQDTTTAPSEPEPRHTIPTAQELLRQIRDGQPMTGGRRDGSMFCEVVMLPEGYAFRRVGSQSDNDWQWLRSDDFERDFIAYSFVNEKEYEAMIITLTDRVIKWRDCYRMAVNAMGKKSQKRFGLKTMKLLDK